MAARALGGALLVWLATGGAVPAQAPLSAIGWLSESVASPAPAPVAPEAPAVAGTGIAPPVTTSVLGAPSANAAGVLPSSVTGLPRALWGLGRAEEIAALLVADRSDALPAQRALLFTLLLAEAEPPPDATGEGLLLARVDALLAAGALDQAQALIEAAGMPGPDLFRRAFDVALLTGHEDRSCAEMVANPALAPTFPARIFCLARSGDWNAAALTLRTGVALGHLGPGDEALLSRFLDPDLYEGEGSLTPPDPVTPLAWRMLEAVGETLPTGPLPLAFAHAELRETAGWKARIEAAERLTRAGVIAPNLLLGVYTEGQPSASGGVWDRVGAFQDFEAALSAADPARVAATLPPAWEAMMAAELEVPFAELFADRLSRLTLDPLTAALAFRIALLSPRYERAALARVPEGAREAFWIAVAKGDLTGVVPPDSLSRAIAPAFAATPDPGPRLAPLAADRRYGEAILHAIDRIRTDVRGDLRGLAEGLALLRALGLEDVARRTALELLLLERRG
jgi:hypothetical protein